VQRPVVVLLHGLLQGPAIWDEVATELAAVADVRCADLNREATIEAMATQALALCGDRPATVVGYSMGGYVALEMLARQPGSIGCLVLLSTSARAESDEARARRERLMALSGRDFGAVIELLIRLGLHPENRGDTPAAARLRRIMQPVPPDTYRQHCRSIMARPDRRELLRTARPPVLAISGELDEVMPPELSDEMAALAPQGERRVIAGAGHTAPLEQPKRLARLIASDCLPKP
jgi:pimeloyl-ACP methyl ester carboxylesterase